MDGADCLAARISRHDGVARGTDTRSSMGTKAFDRLVNSGSRDLNVCGPDVAREGISLDLGSKDLRC